MRMFEAEKKEVFLRLVSQRHVFKCLFESWLQLVSSCDQECPTLLLTLGFPNRIDYVTYLPRLSPVRVTRIMGRFFYALSLGRSNG
jgi:hypothetical protein